MEHRCPRCGSIRAERRTARNVRERAALAVLGYHPYRCLDCERRFLDRPLARGAGGDDVRTAALRNPADPGEPAAPEHATTLAITTDGAAPPRLRRRTRWVVDPGDSPLGRSEIYTLVVAAAVLLLLALVVLRVVWPEATGGVKLGGD